MTAAVAATPNHGSLILNSDGSFTYSPASGYVGPDSFGFTVTDGILTASSTVLLTVVAGAPVAVNHSYGVQAGQVLTVAGPGLLTGAQAADNQPLMTSLVTGAADGTVTVNADGSFSYTPNSGFTGPDSFVYAVSEGNLNTTATVSLNVHDTNAIPQVSNVSYVVLHDRALTIPVASGVLASATDTDGDPLTAALVSGSGPSDGTVTLNSDGSFTYTPNAGFTGTDTFQFVANDGLADSGAATATIAVTDPNSPMAGSSSYSIGRNNTLTVTAAAGVLANATDADGDQLTASVVAGHGPSNGTLILSPDGSFTYVPNAGYMGTDTFQYVVSDGVLLSNPATVSISVTNSALWPPMPATAYCMIRPSTRRLPPCCSMPMTRHLIP